MTSTRHAEIAGAGFAGLVAAIALVQRGWTVRVHERNEELRALGAGIFLWDNGLRVLEAIGALDAVIGGAHEAGVYEDRHENQTTARTQFRAGRNTRMLTMTRQHLYAAILRVAERNSIDILTGSEVIGAETDGRLITANGDHFAADLVVAADGVTSNVRESLGLRSERTTGMHGIIRVLAPRSLAALGPGTWDHVIDFWNLPKGSLRILYVPCNDTELYLAMMSPLDYKEASIIPPRQDVWQDAFPQLAPVIEQITTAGRFDAYETSKLSQWSVGRVAIVGDAAHAMVPSLGQGAGLAMANALSLAVHTEGGTAIEEVLPAWEAQERPLTEYTQDQSARVAKDRVVNREPIWTAATLRAAESVPTGCLARLSEIGK